MKKISIGKTVLIGLFFAACVVGGLFAVRAVLFADVAVLVQVVPAEADVTLRINREAIIEFKGETLVELPQGEHFLQIIAAGYVPRDVEVQVLKGTDNSVKIELVPLPGLLSVLVTDLETEEPIAGIPVLVNGSAAGSSPVEGYSLPAGAAEVELVLPPDYISLNGSTRTIELAGLGQTEITEFLLQRNRGSLTITTIPQGAVVINRSAGDRVLGVTPLEVELVAGFPQNLEVELSDEYRPWITSVVLSPGEEQAIGPHRFRKKPGTLNVTTEPNGATILRNNVPVGTSPLALELEPDEESEITATLANYADKSARVRIGAGKTSNLNLKLTSLFGKLEVTSEPEGVAVLIDGELEGLTPLTKEMAIGMYSLVLKLGPDTRELSAEILEDAVTRKHVSFIEPKEPAQQGEESGGETPLPEHFEVQGIRMVLVPAGKFQRVDTDMGAQPALIEISEPFYVSQTEISNASWESLMKAAGRKHVVGNFDMTLPDYPVVQITWDQAAEFCDVLSKALELDPFYSGSANPTPEQIAQSGGFRLPTEAEFDYLLRFSDPSGKQPYVWGDRWPPARMTGNFADASAQRQGAASRVIVGYEDGFAFTAPVNSYSDHGPSLKNLSGNVMEWCHDSFANLFFRSQFGKTSVDPVAAEASNMKVVKGGSFLTVLPAQLNVNYRAAKRKDAAADDLGFRVVLPAKGMRTLMEK